MLVTGASMGIGLASARALVAAGAHVVMGARSLDRLRAEAAALGPQAHAVALDVTSTSSVSAAVDEAIERFGPIDVVVNNAGNGGRLSFVLESAPEHMREMFEVHVFGMERVTRAVLPGMLSRGRGTIVNVASTVAYVPMPAAAAYCSAKAAVVAFSHSLRGELAETPVNVMLFSPPHTRTEAGQRWPLRLPKIFEPEYVAAALVRALRRDAQEVVAGGNRSLLWIQRASPRLADRIMRRIGLDAARKAIATAAITS